MQYTQIVIRYAPASRLFSRDQSTHVHWHNSNLQNRSSVSKITPKANGKQSKLIQKMKYWLLNKEQQNVLYVCTYGSLHASIMDILYVYTVLLSTLPITLESNPQSGPQTFLPLKSTRTERCTVMNSIMGTQHKGIFSLKYIHLQTLFDLTSSKNSCIAKFLQIVVQETYKKNVHMFFFL